jgi:hypothetical protein
VVSARIWLCLYWFDHQCVLNIVSYVVLTFPQNEPGHGPAYRFAR